MEFGRHCPNCGRYRTYSSKWTLNSAIKKNSICRNCAIAKASEAIRLNGGMGGEKNPFWGKKHGEEVRLVISSKRKGQRNSPATEFKKGCIPNTKPIYDCWMDKYGKEEADKRWAEFRRKQANIRPSKGYVKLNGRHEHRVVMEEILGRKLLKSEVIHHKDGNKKNNNRENLEILTRSEHAKLHNTKNRICSIEGCGRKHEGLGYCEKHKRQFKGDKLC